jgi:hypothetical protein
MAREVSTSTVMLAVSNTLQCPWRMQYANNFGAVAVFVWLDGFDTRAQYAIRSSPVLMPCATRSAQGTVVAISLAFMAAPF